SGGWDIDFANLFASRNPEIGDPEKFVVTDSVFAEFKEFINPDEFKYDKAYEAYMKTLRESLESEGYLTDTVSNYITGLEQLLRRDLGEDLDHNRRELNYLLIDAIVPRYGFRRAALAAELPYNDALTRAVELFSDPEAYKAILAPQK
ncbi:MAG: hypothetical protein K2M40_01585, partial [Muribaculaceae bacterium]|nr:hypothetical protein [Muribaculaceae bacterium]